MANARAEKEPGTLPAVELMRYLTLAAGTLSREELLEWVTSHIQPLAE
jgi:hypothetical protein